MRKIAWMRSHYGIFTPPAAGFDTIGDLIDRYITEVSPRKKGARWEILRLKAIRRSIGSVRLKDLAPAQIAKWRDARLKKVSSGAVLREITLLSGVFTVAMKEWGVMASNPVRMIAKPKSPPHRERIFTDDEIVRLMEALGVPNWREDYNPSFSGQAMPAAEHNVLCVNWLLHNAELQRCNVIPTSNKFF